MGHHGFEDSIAIANFDEDEVRVAGDVVEAEIGELRLQVGAAFIGDGFGFILMLLVVEAGEGTSLSDGVDIEGLAGALQDVDQLFVGDAVADAGASETLDLGEGAEDDDVATLADVFDGVGRVVEELVVSFVKDDDHMVGHFVHEAIDLLLANQGAGGVVGIGNEDFLGSRGNGGGHGFEIMDVAGIIDLDGVGTEDFGHEFINKEGVLGGDDVIPRLKEGVADEFDDFITAAADDEIGHFEVELLGEGLTETVGGAVWIDVNVLDGVSHGNDGLGAGPEGIFV